MIPKDFITEWRQLFPWPMDSQVEQDLIISRALVVIFSMPELADALAFRGGTALHKLHIQPAGRYSEDIDLVQVRPEPIGPTLDQLRSVLDPWLGVPKREFSEGSAKLIYRMQSEDEPSVPMRLKVEINTREHFSVKGLRRHHYRVNSRWYEGSAEITTFTLEELLGTKLRALYQRKKGRDLFDLWLCLRDHKVVAKEILVCFREYMKRGGNDITLSLFIENLATKMNDKRFTQDISPLLRPELHWNLTEAMNLVRQKLLSAWP
jgi:predicted nucleotidyltransferase component of viral defense system